MIKIKVRFEDCLEPIPSASTTKEISILVVFQTHPALRAPAVHGVSSYNAECLLYSVAKTVFFGYNQY